MKDYKIFLLSFAAFAVTAMIIFTGGCTATDSTYNSDISLEEENPVTATESPASTAEMTNQPTPSDKNSPKYQAGMIASDNKGNLRLITAYDKDRERYTTRVLLKGDKGNKNEAYLLKDGSFKELGITFDGYKSFDSKYPYEFDDLNLNPDTESYYNYEEKSGNRIYVYTSGAIPKYIGYLVSGTPESMDFVNTNS